MIFVGEAQLQPAINTRLTDAFGFAFFCHDAAFVFLGKRFLSGSAEIHI
jgi:hypothetical protein